MAPAFPMDSGQGWARTSPRDQAPGATHVRDTDALNAPCVPSHLRRTVVGALPRRVLLASLLQSLHSLGADPTQVA